MNHRPWWVATAQLTGVGWYIAVAILIPTLLGVWLDRLTGLAPLFLLAGLFLGLVLSFYGTLRMLSAFLGSQKDRGNRGRKR